MDAFQKEKKILQQLEKTRDVIRRKHMLLKQDKASFENTLNETFKPIVNPLEKLVNIAKDSNRKVYKDKSFHTDDNDMSNDLNNLNYGDSQSSDDSVDTVMNDTAFETAGDDDDDDDDSEVENVEKKYLTMLKKNRKQYLDNLYGVKKAIGDKDKFTIGDSPITFNKDSIVVNGTSFPKTVGLLELLFRREPDSNLYNSSDKLNYRDILELSSAHKKSYDKNQSIRSFRSKKFHHIIAPLFGFSVIKKSKIGKGFIPPYKITRKGAQKDYVYWDDPNELVDRLRLLVAEVAAGNSSHVNEIHSIIEELREGDYIY